MIIAIQFIEWRSLDETPEASRMSGPSQAVLVLFRRKLAGYKPFMASWNTVDGVVNPAPDGFEFLAWAYFPEAPTI